MNMELISCVLICLLFSTTIGKPGESKDEDGGHGGGMGPLKKEMHRITLGIRKHINEKFEALTNVTLENGAKLDHITEVVETVRRTQKFLMVCFGDVCGEHGTCDLSTDEQSYECHCEEGYGGKQCKITGLCKIDLYETNKLPPMPGMEYPNCADDGSYAGMQFIGSQAYCVTRDNVEISGYSVNRGDTGDHMNCQCARDEHDHQLSGTKDIRVFNCLPNGNYPRVACNSEFCWCQDLQGHEDGERVPAGEEPQC